MQHVSQITTTAQLPLQGSLPPQNREKFIRHLREHYVDSSWAQSAVMPRGKYDPAGKMIKTPDPTPFRSWLDRWPDARNYYIIVEALSADGRVQQVPVLNEETGRIEHVSKWGLRVEEGVFQRIAEDKQDDGIIQQRKFGVKQSGQLQPDYLIPTTGAAITQW